MVYLYGPACGHCKRFFLVWNQLASMIPTDWNVRVLAMDVTQNEVPGMDPAHLPAVYYISPHAGMTVRYNALDKYGNGVGRHDDPLEVMDWMLNVGDFEKEEVLLANLLEKEEKEDAKE
mmetsp:Transcript_13212/g.30764  ORF Transcript_13212/g.30764 Transcript_13212/m.30764 type:complete len:119 (+) Transcript_13212:330-686(+)